MNKHVIKTVLLSMVLFLANDIFAQNSTPCLECIDNIASGDKSTAIGFGSRAIGDYSFVSGYESTASGISSVSMGHNSNADGHYSVAIGPYTYAKPQSYAIGDHANANVQLSVAIGHYVTSNASRAFVIGSALNSAPLINSTPSSLMIGFESSFPTLFVGRTPYGSQFGKVGIGTITPNATLDINGDLLCKGFTMPQPGIREGWVLTTIDERGNSMWVPSQSLSLWGYNEETGDIYRDRGNVGIGMVDPLSKLEVRGQVAIGYHVAALIDENNLIVDGKVGIGTFAPNEELEVIGKIKTDNFQLLNGQLNGNILQCDNEGNATWVDPSLINDGDWTLLANNLYVDAGRNVGIGTSTPTQPLDVVGNIKVSGEIYGGHNNSEALRIFAGTNSNDGAYISMNSNYSNNAALKLFARGTNGTIEFHNHSEQVMTIRGDNNVYVGHYDLVSNLTVYGEVKAHIIRATATIPWWDVVFEDGYELMPLNELEKFVDEHHHLPDMPTEEQVHEEGIDIAEMNALLLKKVEELTLYLIELKKENEEIREEIKIIKEK